jgi:methylase of polypeptide subunit release factors
VTALPAALSTAPPVAPVQRLLDAHRETGETTVVVRGLKLWLPGLVFNPTLSKAATFFLDVPKCAPGDRVLDVFAGSGVHAALAARCGARAVAGDIDATACRTAQRNAALNGVAHSMSVVQSDTFAAFADGRFDVVIANPPLLDGYPRNALEQAVMSPGLYAARQLVHGLPRVLAPGGSAFVLASSTWWDAGFDPLFEASRSGLRAAVIATSHQPYEDYFAIRMERAG